MRIVLDGNDESCAIYCITAFDEAVPPNPETAQRFRERTGKLKAIGLAFPYGVRSLELKKCL